MTVTVCDLRIALLLRIVVFFFGLIELENEKRVIFCF